MRLNVCLMTREGGRGKAGRAKSEKRKSKAKSEKAKVGSTSGRGNSGRNSLRSTEYGVHPSELGHAETKRKGAVRLWQSGGDACRPCRAWAVAGLAGILTRAAPRTADGGRRTATQDVRTEC